MGRQPRHWEADKFYFITNRCEQGKFFFRPDREFNRIALGCLAYFANYYNIELICFVFMSNHFHLIARARNLNMSKFMQAFQTRLAEKTNALRGRENGTIFPRRFKATPILDAASLKDKIAYTLTNPVKDNLVTHVEAWPGISSWATHTNEKRQVGLYFKKTDLHREKRKVNISHIDALAEVTKRCLVTLHIPDCFDGDSDAERRENLVKFVEDHRKKLRKELGGKSVVGAKKIVRCDWNATPDDFTPTPCPLCHASCPKRRAKYRQARKEITGAYRKAVRQLRVGKTGVKFPVGTIPPGWSRCYTAQDAGVDPPE